MKSIFHKNCSSQSKHHNWSDYKTLNNKFEKSVLLPPIEKIEVLLDAVNNSSQHVRNFYITFLLAGTYISIIIWSTTDMMLLKETPVSLPLLNAELPIIEFYRFAPYFWLFLHFNLLLQLYLLSDKLHNFELALRPLRDSRDKQFFYTRLFPFAFNHVLCGHQHPTYMKYVLTIMVWITVICLPLGLLIGLQIGLLAYHSETILFYQRLAVGIDLVFLMVFWPIVRAPKGKRKAWLLQAINLSSIFSVNSDSNSGNNREFYGKPLLEAFLITIILFSVFIFSFGVIVLPESHNEKLIAKLISVAGINSWLSAQPLKENGQNYFQLTQRLFDDYYQKDSTGKSQKKYSFFHRNIRLRNKLLIANKIMPEVEMDLRYGNEKERDIALKKIKPLILRNRDLRYADFSGSLLPKVDFGDINSGISKLENVQFPHAFLFGASMVNAQLRNANFFHAQLQSANLHFANLQDANLFSANLQDAYMDHANLQSAKLHQANLQDVNLSSAYLQDAMLSRANLKRANLFNANLRGSNLYAAELQGANLENAKLQGAKLEKAELQGAILKWADLHVANLQGATLKNANLNNAKLQGANLRNTQLQGAYLFSTQLQGANLNSANLQGSTLRWAQLQSANLNTTNLKLSDITGATFGNITKTYIDELLKKLSDHSLYPVTNSELLNKLKDTLFEATMRPITLTNALGQEVWVEEPDYIVQEAFKDSKGNLEFADSKLDYENGLAGFFIKLKCHNKWIASEIKKYRKTITLDSDPLYLAIDIRFAQCLLNLKDIINKFGQAVCPGLSKISKKDIDRLKETASKTLPEQNTLYSFKCEA